MPSYAAVASAEGPNGLFATLETSRLIIRCAETKLLLRNIDLDPKLVTNVRHMRWFKPAPRRILPADQSSSPAETGSVEDKVERLLIATPDNVYVYEVSNQRWNASIKKVCGGEGGQKISSVQFGANPDEVVAHSTLGLKVAITSLSTGAVTEVRDPKAPAMRTHSLRPRSGHLAILTRSAAKDIITVLSPDRKLAEFNVPLPTVDAQGVRWSPDGNWIAVWDTAAAGSTILIYTATGKLFKRLSGGGGGPDGKSEDLGYGIQQIDWDPSGKYLLVAANERKMIFLSVARGFRPVVALDYPSVIGSAHAQIHQERIETDGSRAYSPASQPTTPPLKSSALGFNHIAVAPSGDLLACVPSAMPTTVWIHSTHPDPQLTAILIHHNTVKQVSWHPRNHGLLMLLCSVGSGDSSESGSQHVQAVGGGNLAKLIYLWGYNLPEPFIVPVEMHDGSGLTRALWLDSALKTQVMASSATTCTLISVLEQDIDNDDEGDFPTPKPISQLNKRPVHISATPASVVGYDDYGDNAETPATNASAFSPVKMDTAQLTRTLGFQFTSLNDVDTDDTFDFKRPIRSRG